MKLCIISDTHGFHEKIKIPQCDLLIHCGDFSRMGQKRDTMDFLQWLTRQPAKYKVFIAGNHDLPWEGDQAWKQRTLKQLYTYEKNIYYLENSGKEIEGLELWGSPYQPEFFNWAFMLPRGGNKLDKVWQQIPRSTDILITHSPPKGILDHCHFKHAIYPQDAGCELLRHRIEEVETIKLHCFGHIHEAAGMDTTTLPPTIFTNASSCNLKYQPVNKPVVIDL